MLILSTVDAALQAKLEPIFLQHQRVDFGIDSLLQGQTGQQVHIIVNDVSNPQVALLRYGIFGILGGDASHEAAGELIDHIQLPCAIQPSPANWLQLLQTKHGDSIKTIERFSFTHESIHPDLLTNLIQQHPHGHTAHGIDEAMARMMEKHEWHQYHFMNYGSPEAFARHGFATGITIDGELASVCSAALRCQQGIELNIITLPHHRNKGLAEVVAAHTIKKAIEQNLVPHWDAGNPSSARLAARLGYTPTGSYFTHYIPKV